MTESASSDGSNESSTDTHDTAERSSDTGTGGSMYSEDLINHYRNPQNQGELEDPTFRHSGENSSCGDTVEIDVELAEDDKTIESIGFTTDSCAITKASTSLLSEKLVGKTLDEAMELTNDDIVDMLGINLTPARITCATMSNQIVKDGIKIHRDELDASEHGKTTISK